MVGTLGQASISHHVLPIFALPIFALVYQLEHSSRGLAARLGHQFRHLRTHLLVLRAKSGTSQRHSGFHGTGRRWSVGFSKCRSTPCIVILLLLETSATQDDPLNHEAAELFRKDVHQFERLVNRTLRGGLLDGVYFERLV
jgi:hypothetical protein